MKTVKELADQLGVSKTTIYKRIDELQVRDKLSKNGNRFTIPQSVETLIVNTFQENNANQSQAGSQTESQIANQQIIDSLIEQLKQKDDQLMQKDQQIESLHCLISETTKALQQAQSLQLLSDQRSQQLQTELKALTCKVDESIPDGNEPQDQQPQEQPQGLSLMERIKNLFR